MSRSVGCTLPMMGVGYGPASGALQLSAMSVKSFTVIGGLIRKAVKPQRVEPPYLSSMKSPRHASWCTKRPSSTHAVSLPGQRLGLDQVPMLVVTMFSQGSPGKKLSVAQPPLRPAALTHLVVPLKSRAVCCLGLLVTVLRQPAPSLTIVPAITGSSTEQMIVPGRKASRAASATTGPKDAGVLPGTNGCSAECGATMAYDCVGWKAPGVLERPGMWMKRSAA